MTFARTLFFIFHRKMSSHASATLTPLGVRGMKILDREKFLRKIQTPVLKVAAEKLSKITPNCKDYFLKLENFKPVQNDSDIKLKCIFLNPEKVTNFSDISEDHRQALHEVGVTESNFSLQNIELAYDNWSYGTIFKSVLPENEDIVSGFTQVGHIIHLNLKDHLLEYRSLIGQVLVDKIKSCRTVVNKSSIIDNTYRNFAMEVIAGEEDFLVTVKENQCNFLFNFSKVYWNSRLGQEHERILGFLKAGDVLFDVFCGVGPFVIPAVKKKCKVFANDLNPDSYKWLNHNAKLNKLNMNLFNSYNLDGKDFILNKFKEYVTNYCLGKERLEKGSKIHVTMNLPAIAVEFLKYFKGLIEDQDLADRLDCEIIVYVYCFVHGDSVQEAKTLVIENIGYDISNDIIDVYDVRNVSPKKEMMRVGFRLSKEVIFSAKDCVSEPPKKKLCVENQYVVCEMPQPREDVCELPDFTDALEETEQVLRKCFKQYQPQEVFLAFNGGKDCTVLLDITANVLLDVYKTSSVLKNLKILYIRTHSPFRELEAFVKRVELHYGIELAVTEGEMKTTLQRILDADPRLKACLMGTRRTDPYSGDLQFMQKTDENWPQVMRVSPLLNWSYHQIWSYILRRQVPYCSLYDIGYTSIGSTKNTWPNPALEYTTCSGTSYRPAWELADGALERAGRVSPTEGKTSEQKGH